jgi:hypothetical protein
VDQVHQQFHSTGRPNRQRHLSSSTPGTPSTKRARPPVLLPGPGAATPAEGTDHLLGPRVQGRGGGGGPVRRSTEPRGPPLFFPCSECSVAFLDRNFWAHCH